MLRDNFKQSYYWYLRETLGAGLPGRSISVKSLPVMKVFLSRCLSQRLPDCLCVPETMLTKSRRSAPCAEPRGRSRREDSQTIDCISPFCGLGKKRYIVHMHICNSSCGCRSARQISRRPLPSSGTRVGTVTLQEV